MTSTEYNRCVDQYADNLYRFVLSNTRDEELAKDVVQDTFEKLWRKHEEVEFEKSRAYMFTTAYRLVIDNARREKFRGKLEDADLRTYGHSNQYTGAQEVLHNAIAKLPPDQRSVILLRDYEGYDYAEIGKITGLNESQVKVYIYRGRTFLKKYLGSMEAVI